MGTHKDIEELEHLTANLIGALKSAQVLALRIIEPHNLRELQSLIHNLTVAKERAITVRNRQLKEK